MISLLVLGLYMLLQVNLWGLVPFVLGGIMMQGIKGPVSKPTKKVWLLTFFGKQTDTVVEGLTMVLDWLPIDVVGFIEVDMAQIDHDFILKKKIRCLDNVYMSGSVSVSMKPNKANLQGFLSIGEIEGAKKQLDDLLTVWVQVFAKDKTSAEMEIAGEEMINKLLKLISGLPTPDTDPDSHVDDTRGFGLEFPKFQVVLNLPDEVIKTRNNRLTELAEREAELEDTETINQQIIKRMSIDKSLSAKEARQQIFDEKVLKADKYTKIVNEGGVNIANVGSVTSKP